MALEPSFAAPSHAQVVTGPEVDAVDRLEALGMDAAAEKLRRFRRLRDRAHDALLPAQRRFDEAHANLRRAQNDFDRIREAYSRGSLTHVEERPVPFVQAKTPGERQRVGVTKRVEPDTARLERERKAVAKLEREVADLRDERHTLERAWQAIGGLVADLERWAQELPRNTKLKAWAGEPPTLRKGENIGDALARCEATVQAVQAEIDLTESAPRRSGDVIAKVLAEVDQLAARGRPDIFEAVEAGEPVRWPTLRESVEVFTAEGQAARGGVRIADALGLIAWVAGDALKEKLRVEIALRADDDAALGDEERAAKLADLASKKLLAERHVEHWLGELEKSGMQPARVRGADPRAVLGIEIVSRGRG